MKIREWFIKKLVGNKPVIMNVTLILDAPIMASEPNVIIDKSNIDYSTRIKEGN
ncbi:hypothetical protein [Cytobacillus firmus]|uniref:hypothetical protein n=1 Tax=Cytobacillus firmus TaxID=1399 RepID=UPI001CFDEFC2|nr:hypothetical protein [Cytobacillus firmus]